MTHLPWKNLEPPRQPDLHRSQSLPLKPLKLLHGLIQPEGLPIGHGWCCPRWTNPTKNPLGNLEGKQALGSGTLQKCILLVLHRIQFMCLASPSHQKPQKLLQTFHTTRKQRLRVDVKLFVLSWSVLGPRKSMNTFVCQYLKSQLTSQDQATN